MDEAGRCLIAAMKLSLVGRSLQIVARRNSVYVRDAPKATADSQDAVRRDGPGLSKLGRTRWVEVAVRSCAAAKITHPFRRRRLHAAPCDARHLSRKPPSTCRLTPLIPRLSRSESAAAATLSIVVNRPVGVRARVASIRAGGISLTAGLSPTAPGWMALTRTGASSTASLAFAPCWSRRRSPW
jgi:hypothetical protein